MTIDSTIPSSAPPVQPGTLGSINPEPALITEMRQSFAEGTNRRDIVDTLAGRNLSRDDVQAAYTYWLNRMHRSHWFDRSGNRVQKALEELLRIIPGKRVSA